MIFGILHGESKRDFINRAVELRRLLLRIPDGFLNGNSAEIQESMNIFSQETIRSEAKPGGKYFKMDKVDEYADMNTSSRLHHFFKSIAGSRIFHAWQCCLDFPAAIYDKKAHKIIGPTSYIFLRLTFRKVEFPTSWSSQAGQSLGVRLLEYARHLPEMRGLNWQKDVLSFNDFEHWTCDTVKCLKALYNHGLLNRILEFSGVDVLPVNVLPLPDSGRFRSRSFGMQVGNAGSAAVYNSNLLYVPRKTSSLPLMRASQHQDEKCIHEPVSKRQATMSNFLRKT